MLQKPAGELTVKEITDHVGVNRGTFYKYYKSIPDMIGQIENKMAEDFQAIVNKPINEDVDIYPRPLLIYIFVFLRENADMCLLLLSPNGNSEFIMKLVEIVRVKFMENFEGLINTENQSNFEYFSSFVSSGCISVFEKWIRTGMKETPGEMAELTINLILHAFKVLL